MLPPRTGMQQHYVRLEVCSRTSAELTARCKQAVQHLTQRQDAEGLLNLDPNLLNAKQKECNQAGGRNAEEMGGLVQGEGHQCQPCNQET